MFRRHKKETTTTPTTATGGTRAEKERFMSPRQEPSPDKPASSSSLTIGEKPGQYSGVSSYTTSPATTSTVASSSSASSGTLSETAPATAGPDVCTICGKPQMAEIAPIKSEHSPIVKEFIVPSIREEITPEIFREREQQQVKFIVQPIQEKVIEPTSYENRVEPCITKDVTIASREAVDRELISLREREKSGSFTRPCLTERVDLPPIVHEAVTHRLVEEVQPIIEREVMKTTVVKIIKPIHEKVVECPVLSTEVMPILVRESAPAAVTTSPVLPQKLHHHKEPTY